MHLVIVLILAVGLEMAHARPGTLGQEPILGWNTWCTQNACGVDFCTAAEILDVAAFMNTSGMLEAGFTYINLDDCWGVRNNATGLLEGDPTRFPQGMPALIAQVHELGFQFGLYTDIGPNACHSPFAGSYPNYALDAATFAAWEVDFVKFDGCDLPAGQSAMQLTCNMSQLLTATSRPVWFNFHCWGDDACAACGNSFRIGPDHHDSWESTSSIISLLANRSAYWGPNPAGGFPDPDFVFTGGQGCGNFSPAGSHCPGQTDDEYISEFSLWVVAGGQILIASDPRNMTALQRQVWLNPSILQIYKDVTGFAYISVIGSGADAPEDVVGGVTPVMVFARPTNFNAGAALALFNPGNTTRDITAHFATIPHRDFTAKTVLEVRDAWAQTTLGDFTGKYTARSVRPHATVVVTVNPQGLVF